MVLRPELAPGRQVVRPGPPASTGRVPGDVGGAPVWDANVWLRLPDAELAQAIEVARAAVVGRSVLQPALDGASRLAQRLAHANPDDPRLPRLLGVLRSRARDGLVHDAQGRPDPDATSLLGRCECSQRDPRAWDRVRALAAPLTDMAVGQGPPNLAAALLAVVGDLLGAARNGELAILPVLPDDWFGEDVEVRGLPMTASGRLSWSLTWPEDWPVLHWATSVPGVRVTSPGVLPGWSDPRPRGASDDAGSRSDPGHL